MKTLLLSIVVAAIAVAVLGSEDKTTVASWYGEKYRGKATASGEPFNPWIVTGKQ